MSNALVTPKPPGNNGKLILQKYSSNLKDLPLLRKIVLCD